MTITADVKGCTVTLRQPPLSGGTVGAVTVVFRFDAVWDGYVRTAVFRAHGKTVLVLLENDSCMLPSEATAGGDVLLGAFGVRGDATLTTKFCRLAVSPGVPTAGDSAAAVTPTLGAQLLAAYGRLTAATAEATAGDRAAVCVSEEADSLHFAFTLPKGDPGKDGIDGYTPQKGVDYFTDEDIVDMTQELNDAAYSMQTKVNESINEMNSTKTYVVKSTSAAATAANNAADAANNAVAELEAKVAAGDFKGDKGDPGADGKDGYTPVRGTDYWTETDRAEIRSYVDDAILGGSW